MKQYLETKIYFNGTNEKASPALIDIDDIIAVIDDRIFTKSGGERYYLSNDGYSMIKYKIDSALEEKND